MAVAGAVLQRDSPDPAALLRDGARERREVRTALAGHRPRAVARQPVRPVLPRTRERVAEQQRAEAAAVDEEITVYLLSGFERERADVTGLAVQRDVDHLAFDARHPAPDRPTAQEVGVQAGVEVIGVAVERRVRMLE